MFIVAVLIIAIISVAWAFWSLRSLRNHHELTHAVRKELTMNRVLFQSETGGAHDSSSEDSGSSSMSSLR